MSNDRAAAYRLLHNGQLATWDVDPAYPMLKNLAVLNDLDREQTAWLAMLHLIWYQIGSDMAAFERAPSAKELPSSPERLEQSGLLSLPTGVERRSLRSQVNMVRHLLTVRQVMVESGGVDGWLQQAAGTGGTGGWTGIMQATMRLPFSGRFCGYKMAELAQKVVDVPVVAPDAGHRHSSGPRKGLRWLDPRLPDASRNSEQDIRRLDRATGRWARWLDTPDVALVETTLCAFATMSEGNNYLGRDTDLQLDHVASDRLTGVLSDTMRSQFRQARQMSFPPSVLGEQQGWCGVRKRMLSEYARTGVVVGADVWS